MSKPGTKHPIIDAVTPGLEKRGGVLVFKNEHTVRVHEALRAYMGKPELVGALEQLTYFAGFLCTRMRSPEAAAALINIAAAYVPGLQAMDMRAASRLATQIDAEKKRVKAFQSKYLRPGAPGGGGLPNE